MAIALVATIWGIVTQTYIELIVALLIGGTVGLIAARRVQMTQMPELVAILHSLVGLAAVAVGFANFMDPQRLAHYTGVELTIHERYMAS
jgi:NAD(P) transhydrogenase subunit beta